jgi:hypothetical protein
MTPVATKNARISTCSSDRSTIFISATGYRIWALALYALGQRTAADAALTDLQTRFGDTAAFTIAMNHAYRGDVDQSFAWLQHAYATHDRSLTWLQSEPLAQNIKADPRYDAMLRKMKLVD